MSEDEKFHEELEKLATKYGICDHMFFGVDLKDEDRTNIYIGHEGSSSSNRRRGHRLIGLIHETIHEYLNHQLGVEKEDDAERDI